MTTTTTPIPHTFALLAIEYNGHVPYWVVNYGEDECVVLKAATSRVEGIHSTCTLLAMAARISRAAMVGISPKDTNRLHKRAPRSLKAK